MNKKTKYIIYFICTIMFVIMISYYMYIGGVTSKILGNAKRLTNPNEVKLNKNVVNSYPIIDYVINSSDEKMVNTDVVLSVKASSKYKIKRLEYSYDLKKWKRVNKKYNSLNINDKIVFSNTINKDVYIRVVNEKNYKSYAYKTKVSIDKKLPSIKVIFEDDNLIVSANDNNELLKFQYSNDQNEWTDEIINGKKVINTISNFEYKYVRVVDKVGNISEIKEVK